jgi:hypothetical protein
MSEVREVSGRIMSVKLASSTGGITFFSVYAPPADHKTSEKDKFYDDLTREINKTEGIYYIGGDFNARLYEVMQHEKGVIGNNIIGRSGYINCQEKGKGINVNTRKNRDLFIDFLKKHELVASNTRFEKEAKKTVTYKEKCRHTTLLAKNIKEKTQDPMTMTTQSTPNAII